MVQVFPQFELSHQRLKLPPDQSGRGSAPAGSSRRGSAPSRRSSPKGCSQHLRSAPAQMESSKNFKKVTKFFWPKAEKDEKQGQRSLALFWKLRNVL